MIIPCINRADLKEYWQKVVAIDKVTDFAKHHCSEEIKAFLDVDQNTRNKVGFFHSRGFQIVSTFKKTTGTVAFIQLNNFPHLCLTLALSVTGGGTRGRPD